jgi:hypothetical protein
MTTTNTTTTTPALTWITAPNTDPAFKAKEVLTATLKLSTGDTVFTVIKSNGGRHRLLVNGVKTGADAEGANTEMRQTAKAEELAQEMKAADAPAPAVEVVAEAQVVEAPAPVEAAPEVEVIGYTMTTDDLARYAEVSEAYAGTHAEPTPEPETFPLVNPDADTGSTEVAEVADPIADEWERNLNAAEERRMAELNKGVVTEVIDANTSAVPVPEPKKVTVKAGTEKDGWSKKLPDQPVVSACKRGVVTGLDTAGKKWGAAVDGKDSGQTFKTMKAAKEWANAEIAKTAAPVNG